MVDEKDPVCGSEEGLARRNHDGGGDLYHQLTLVAMSGGNAASAIAIRRQMDMVALHFMIVPAIPMSYDQFNEQLVLTRNLWKRCEG